LFVVRLNSSSKNFTRARGDIRFRKVLTGDNSESFRVAFVTSEADIKRGLEQIEHQCAAELITE